GGTAVTCRRSGPCTSVDKPQFSVKNKLDDRLVWTITRKHRTIQHSTSWRNWTALKAPFAGNRLKRFFFLTELDQDRAGRHEVIRVRTSEDDDLPTLADEGRPGHCAG